MCISATELFFMFILVMDFTQVIAPGAQHFFFILGPFFCVIAYSIIASTTCYPVEPVGTSNNSGHKDLD